MDNTMVLYRRICEELGKKFLDDTEIEKIVLFLQGHLGQPGDPVDFAVSESFNVDPYTA